VRLALINKAIAMAIARQGQVQLSVAIWKQIPFSNMEEVWFEHRTKMTIETKEYAS
jgi:hypothetical protein